MNKINKLLLASCLLTQSLCFAAGDSVDRIVAIVNNDVVTSSELTHQTDLIKHQLINDKQAVPSDAELKKHILQRMVDLNLQLQYAAKAGISVNDTDLNNAIAKIAERNHLPIEAMKTQLAAENITFDEYRETLRKDLTVQQLQRETVAKLIRISDEDVQEFMKSAHTGAQNQIYEIADILVPLNENPTTKDLQAAKATADGMKAKLQKGAEFTAVGVAQTLGWRTLAELPDVFTKDVVKLSTGQFAGPIRAGNGFHLIKLTGKKAQNMEAQLSNDQARELIFRRRFDEKSQVWIQQLRARSYVKIMLDTPSDLA